MDPFSIVFYIEIASYEELYYWTLKSEFFILHIIMYTKHITILSSKISSVTNIFYDIDKEVAIAMWKYKKPLPTSILLYFYS